MKTISSRVLEYKESEFKNDKRFAISYEQQIICCVNDFKAGVEFAQRWIPVEEELPPIGVEVIVKERFNEYEIYVFNSTRDRLIKCQDNCITHWRPINRK